MHTISNWSDWPKPRSFTAHCWQGGREKGTLRITGALYFIVQKPIAFGLVCNMVVYLSLLSPEHFPCSDPAFLPQSCVHFQRWQQHDPHAFIAIDTITLFSRLQDKRQGEVFPWGLHGVSDERGCLGPCTWQCFLLGTYCHRHPYSTL